jgi:hypothetical protein
MTTTSSVPKLEGKKNYKTWELRIRPLLDSKDESAAIEYSPRLKSAASERDKKDTSTASLELAERFRVRNITSPEEATTGLIQEIKEARSSTEKAEKSESSAKKAEVLESTLALAHLLDTYLQHTTVATALRHPGRPRPP